MAYEVTATRKRPQKFGDLAGQEFVVSTLSNSIANGRIAHAYLFSGPRGVGKTSAARILARSLNCEKGPTVDPCGECSSCLEISRGSSMDVIEIDGASNTGVNDIREIKDEVLFAPNSSRYKVYIIDEVHMLSNSAFNALLKTIEEPPPYIIFIFATTEIHKVPATIRSRCQQFNFRLIGLERVKDLLVQICEETSTEYEEDALLWIAKEGTGSLRDSYTLYDQVASFSEGNITLDVIREKLGLVGMEQINELMKIMLSGDVSSVMQLADQILASGVSVDQFIVELSEYFRSLLLIKSGVEKQSILGYEKDKFDSSIVDSFREEQILHGQELLFQLYREMRYSLNERFELELLLNRLIHLKSFISPGQILARIERLKQDLKIAHIQDEVSETLGLEDKKKTHKLNTEKTEVPEESEPAEDAANAFFNQFSSMGKRPNPQDPPAENQSENNEILQDSEISPQVEAPSSPQISQPPDSEDPVKKDPIEKAPPVESKASDSDSESTPVPVENLWEQLLLRVRTLSMQLFSLLDSSEEHQLASGVLHLKVSQTFEVHLIEQKERDILSALKELSGQDYTLKIDVLKKEEKIFEENLDDNVELVRKIFQGQILSQGGK